MTLLFLVANFCDALILLQLKQLINHLVLAAQFVFCHVQAGSQLRVLILEVVRMHSLLHHVVVKTFSFLEHDSGPQFDNLGLHSDSFGA